MIQLTKSKKQRYFIIYRAFEDVWILKNYY